MKYMGSKRTLLSSGLGDTIVHESQSAGRVVDLFTGSGSVAWYAATMTLLPVFAFDLQAYAVVLASAVIERTETVDPVEIFDHWMSASRSCWEGSSNWERAQELQHSQLGTEAVVHESRLAADNVNGGAVWNAYGGHYFAPWQALIFDAMLSCVPPAGRENRLALAALIMAASTCAASPGHTAQPFQPTPRAAKYIAEAWARDPVVQVRQALCELSSLRANRLGRGLIGNANVIAKELIEGDLVFVDPPYSSVHYSRFYHVLETIARNDSPVVSGAGRYPPQIDRPSSDYSIPSKASQAFLELFDSLADSRSTVIVTFPEEGASNGVSGRALIEMARQRFNVEFDSVKGRFSSLGGNGVNRSARNETRELVLVMKPL